MAKKKSAPFFVRYRLLVTVIFLTVITAVAWQSATNYQPTGPHPPSYFPRSNLGKNSQAQHRSDNQPRSALPHLMPWRGPVKPLPTEPNAAAVIHEIPTTDPVVFLTIDDGVTQTPEIADLLTSQRLPFTLFLDDHAVRNDYGYFARLQNAGMSIQNHTVNHARLKKLTFEQQKAEICGVSDIFANVFGQRPTLFRPPYGQFNDDTRRAVLECGMKAIVMWRSVVESGQVYFQFDKTHLEAGDIVVMHFTPNFPKDMEAFINQAQKDHLRIGRLEDWLK